MTAAATIKRETVSTDRLRVGDIVWNYGMRLVIDREITTYEDRGTVVYRTLASVANLDAVRGSDIVPESWLYHHNEHYVDGAGWTTDRTDPRWPIQGNHLATWAREAR